MAVAGATQREGTTGLPADRRAIRARGTRIAALWIVSATLLLGTLAFGLLWNRGWLPGMFAPRKLAIRGCMLTDAGDVITLLDCDGTQALPVLWSRARELRGDNYKWLRGVDVGSGWNRLAVLSVDERKPLLLVVSGPTQYWLCDDGWLVPRENETGELFAAILRLPRIALPDDPGAGKLSGSEHLLTIAAACHQYLPGQIAKVALNREGDLTLYDSSGFKVRLGQPKRLTERIAALPKALRVCEGNKDKLLYLDATDWENMVFYQKWRGPVKHMLSQ